MQSEQQFYEERKRNEEPYYQDPYLPEAEIAPFSAADEPAGHQSPRFRQGRPRYLWVMLCLLLLFALGGLINWPLTSTSSTLHSHTFTLPGRSSLQVKNSAGAIHIHQGGTNSIVVAATKHTSGLAILDSLQVQYDQHGNTSIVQIVGGSASPFFAPDSIDLDITVPRASDLDLYDASGTILVDGINGQVKAETGSGALQAMHLQGTLQFQTGSGDIETSDLSGTVTIQSGSGSIHLQGGQIQGESKLHTGSGDIQASGTFAANGNATLESGSGNIDLSLPSNSALQITTHTGSGRKIQNDFNSATIGKEPQARIFLSTGSGAIHIHKQ